MKIHKNIKPGWPIGSTVTKSGIGGGIILLSDNTIIQMINETTIQIIAIIILLIALAVVVKEYLENKNTNAEDIE